MGVVSTILLDLVDFLLDLEEALCRGFLDDRRAVDMAVRRVQHVMIETIME